ncbi:aminotransferase class III-fold pyridoxal phosphate-dependent enzyme, partial [Endobacter medicaginis]
MAALEAAALPGVVAIRGRGLMIALDLDARAGGARRYCEALAAAGLLCKETHDHTIRLAPPLVLSDEEADAIVATLARVFAELA